VTERQRTLRGAIDWSHELLSEAERVLFRRLAVFAGGCALEAVDAVCRPAELGLDGVDAVSSLHDKSLLRRAGPTGSGLRVSMLETLREYGLERLEASGDAGAVRRRHAEFFATVAEGVADRLSGPDQTALIAALDRDLDNVRAAIQWAVDAGEPATGLRLATALELFWVFGNHLPEGRSHLHVLLAVPAPDLSLAVRARATGAAASLAVWQSDYPASVPLAEESLRLFRQLGDLAGVASQLVSLGYASIVRDPVSARRLFNESIETWDAIGRPPATGQSLIGLAMPEMQSREVDEAARHLEEAGALFGRAGDEGMALIADGLRGVCDRLRGDLRAARRRYLDVLQRAETVNAHLALMLPIEALADLAELEGDAERAAVLTAGQAQVAERLGGTPGLQLMGIESVMDRARAALSEERLESAVARGRAMSVPELVAYARGDLADADTTDA
jgi:hypothetical protein